MSGIVACPEPLAAEIGAQAFERGGSAVEAAIAAAFAQGVALPLGCGVAGMAHILVAHRAWTEPRFLNASVAVGARGDPGIFEAAFMGRSERAGRYLIQEDRNQFGYPSIMTPGFVRGMKALQTLGDGRISWSALVTPAAEAASEGFEVYPYLATYYTFEGGDRPGYPDVFHKLAADSTARDQYLPNGRPLRVGEILRQPGYGRTLARIAEDGADAFYTGAIAREIAADLGAHDGLVTAADLAEYDVQSVAPVRGAFRGHTIYTSPPPGHGTVLVSMLNLVDPLELEALGWNSPDYVETIAWATRTAFGDCMPYLADPRFVTVPVDWLVSKDRVAAAQYERQLEIAGGAEMPTDGHTTHVSCADSTGNIVSITHSIGSIAGAGVMTPTLGFLYNNFMGHFNPLRGYHNSIAPGKRMGGGSPTIVYRDGTPWLAIGSSGGSRLISAVFQTLLNAVVFKMPLDDAVAAPRIHSEGGRKIYIEPALASAVKGRLERRGYDVEVTGYMGCNQAVEISPNGLRAASDPRGGGGIGRSES